MACQEAEALRVLFKKHLAEIAVAKTDLAAVSNGARDAEALQTFADCSSSLIRFAAALLDGNCCTYGVSPFCIFKADRLNLLNCVIDIQAGSFGDFLALLDGGNAILLQSSQNLRLSSLI